MPAVGMKPRAGTLVSHGALAPTGAFYLFADGPNAPAADACGGPRATISGGVGVASGRFGLGVSFDGATGMFQVADSPSISNLNLGMTGFTVGFWMRANSFAGGPVLIDKSVAASPTTGWRCTFTAAGLFTLTMPFSVGSQLSRAVAAVPLGQWTHCVATYSGVQAPAAGNIKLYYNGTPQRLTLDTSGTGTIVGDAGQKLFIGASSNNTLFFNGAIDHFLIDRRAYSPLEVQDLYANPFRGFATPYLLFSAPVAAGIQFDATSNSTYQTADASYTWNHTCTGANRYLVVTIAMLSVAGSSVSAITYNSVNLVFLGARATVSGTVRIEMWGLVAPATGTNVIAVTLSASLDSVGEAASFTGVHQTVSTEAFNTATGTATGGDASVTVTSVADNDWVVSGVASDDTAITIATGTQRQNVSGALGSGGLSTFGPQTPAGGVAMTWTSIGALASWAIAGVALRPLAASGLPSQGWGGLLAGWRNFLVGGGDDD